MQNIYFFLVLNEKKRERVEKSTEKNELPSNNFSPLFPVSPETLVM